MVVFLRDGESDQITDLRALLILSQLAFIRDVVSCDIAGQVENYPFISPYTLRYFSHPTSQVRMELNDMDKVKITMELIELGQSNEGGWNQAQLDLVGVGWPPPKGWKQRLCGEEFPQQQLDQFLALKGEAGKKK